MGTILEPTAGGSGTPYEVVVVEGGLDRRVAEALRGAGCRVYRAADGEDAARQLTQQTCDALIAGFRVRLADGSGLLRWVRQTHPDVLRVLSADQADVHLAINGLESGTVHRFVLSSWSPESIARTLGLALQARNPSAVPHPAKGAHASRQKRPTILLVDDERIARGTAATSLRVYGFEVVEASTGAEALRESMMRTPDFALVDLVMPGIDGFRVIQYLKSEHGHRLPVIAMSSLTNPDARVEAFAAGADEFLQKPLDVMDVLRRLDVLERTRWAYEEVRTASERAERLYLYAREASGLLAHDLRNGLAVALVNISFLASELTDDDEITEALAATELALRRINTLVDNFVDIERFEDGELSVRLQEVDVHRLLGKIVGIYEHSVRGIDARVELESPPELWATIDPVLIERVTHNILCNAIRYVSEKGLIRVSARRDRDQLVIELGNTGPEMSRQTREILFDKHVVGGDHKSKRGLGMYFCRLVCEAHQGTIQVDAGGPFGTNFVIRLPLEPPA